MRPPHDARRRVPQTVWTLSATNPRQTSFMRYFQATRDGPSAHCDLQDWIPLREIAPFLIAAAVKAEDPRFFDHHGVDWQATARKTPDDRRATSLLK